MAVLPLRPTSCLQHLPSRVTETRDGASMAQQYYNQNVGVGGVVGLKI